VLFAALAIGAFQVLAIVTAGTALAVTGCTYNPATQTINITIDPGNSAGVAVDNANDLDPESPAGAILFDNNGAGFDNGALSTQCGSASNTNTTSIVVLGSPSADEVFYIDNNSGAEFNTAITWAVDLGSNTAGGVDVFFIDAGNGDDEVTVTDSTFDLNGGGGPLLGAELSEVFGNDGDDVLDGSAMTANIFWGIGGNDDDWVAGGARVTLPIPLVPEVLTGDAGVDTISYGTRTTSTVINNALGVAGHDANGDCDVADAGDEQDTIGGFEVLETGSGNDCIVGLGGVDETYVPGDGDDDVTGNAADDDVLDYSTSSAGVTIDPANETVVGQGNDTFTDVFGFVGSPSDDTLLWDGTTWLFVGGDGTDVVDATASTSGEFIDLDVLDGVPATGTGAPADSTENAKGGTGNDHLDGNDLNNRLEGGDGDDQLDGFAGNDFLIGAAGNDTYSGGDGADKVSFKNSPNGVEADMLLGFANGEGSDTLGGDVEILVGSQFNDNFTGGGGNVATNFRFIGNNGNDIFTGSGSNDTLKGGGGKDTLRGVGGDDTLLGAAGNDRLFGGGGTDIGKGGKGKDTCKSIEIKSSCGKKGHPKRTLHSVAAKLAKLG
jgi:Ca2+-binding RTX toxin-like protein